jgi:DNA-binding GntR family transcriptional regulator
MERVLSGWNVEGLTAELCEQHIGLYRAYEAGDVAAAQKVIRAHVELGRRTAVELIEAAGGAR